MESEREMKTFLAQIDHAIYAHHEFLTEPSLSSLLIRTYDGLNSLRAIFLDPHLPQAFVEEGVLEDLKSVTKDIVSIISKFDLSKSNEKMCYALYDELIEISVERYVNQERVDAYKPLFSWLHSARRIFNEWKKPSREYYPRTGQHGVIDHLVEYLEEVKTKADNSIVPLKYCVIRLQPVLRLVSGQIMKIPVTHREAANVKILKEEVANLAYEIEYAIDLYLVTQIPIWYSVFWLQDIQSELNHKVGQLIAESGNIKMIVRQIKDYDPYKLSIIALLDNTESKDKLDEIMNSVSYRFRVCTRSSVSSYKTRKKEVFLELLHKAFSYHKRIAEDIDKSEYTNDLSEDELKRKVHLLLKEYKHYFIILEDVDDIEDLDDMRSVLVDNGKTNKVLLTTSSQELVAYCRNDFQRDVFFKMTSGENTSISQQYTNPTLEDSVVGFEEESKRMHEWLTYYKEKLQFMSIAGMPGNGKTTLAKKLYNDSRIVNHFDRRVWFCVSQVYEKNKLLLEILKQVNEDFHTINQDDDNKLSEMLYQSLKGYRFFVVVDDIWSTEAWADLKRCFPDDKNGSRIVFTTRYHGLGAQAQPGCDQLLLDGLSEDDSVTLLWSKLNKDNTESFSHELSQVGSTIARLCRGLPLSIVLAAGLLKKTEKRQDLWEELKDTITSSILGESGEVIIGLSFKQLPDSLKPCFLYFGVFLEDTEVPVQELMRLWIAEGFVKQSNSMTLEQVANNILEDLIDRSLITAAKRSSTGGVKSCRVHDLLHQFALEKATGDNFFQQIQRYDEQLSDPITFNNRRLCIYSSDNNHFLSSRAQPVGPHVRSLLFFAASDVSPWYSYDISFIFRNFKLLRILKLEEINIGNSFQEIDVLIHLRFLAVQGTIVSLPSSIAKLLNLETFCVKSVQDKAVEVPDSIWYMEKLRHVHIKDHASFHMNLDIPEKSSVLENLQTLSTPSLAYGDAMEKILRKLRGIRKLKCIFLDSPKGETKFPVLEFLEKLEYLNVFYNGKKQYLCGFNFPSNLKKLTLTNFRMPWSGLSNLTSLLNLEVLKLMGNAFEGDTWEMESDVVFQNLKFLKLDTLDVVEWIATEDQFPCLEHLLLHRCEKLTKIPSKLGDIPTLMMIEVKWCKPSVATSAKKIQEEQNEYSKNVNINV